MDLGALKTNLKTVIKAMPAEMQLDIAHLFHIVIKHLPAIEQIAPLAMGALGNDVQTMAWEFSSGMLNREGLDVAVKEAFAECGIVLPEMSAPVPKV